jgi:hypothetical protein
LMLSVGQWTRKIENENENVKKNSWKQ